MMLAVVLPLSVWAQQVSMDSFKKVLQSSSNAGAFINNSPEQADQIVQLIKTGNSELNDELVKAKVSDYFANNLVDDVAEICYPYYTSLTEADAQQLIKEMNDPKVQDILARIASSSSESTSLVAQQMMNGLIKVMSGETPEPILRKEAPKGFTKEFERFVELSSLDESLDGAFGNIEILKGAFPNAGKAQFDSFIDYVRQSTKNATFNILSKSITLDDLQLYNKIYSTPAGQHLVEGNKETAKHTMEMGTALMQKMMERLL